MIERTRANKVPESQTKAFKNFGRHQNHLVEDENCREILIAGQLAALRAKTADNHDFGQISSQREFIKRSTILTQEDQQ